MVWSFLWRLPLYAGSGAWIFTFVQGFVMGLFGANATQINEAGYVFQVLGLLAGAAAAYTVVASGVPRKPG